MPILVGTASWTDKSLIGCGRFYPKEASSAEARLRYYATQFPMVEVGSSYYAMPSVSNAQRWAERTPASSRRCISSLPVAAAQPRGPCACGALCADDARAHGGGGVSQPDLAIVRLHGRNRESWNQKGLTASERFNYDYAEQELAALASDIRQLATQVGLVQAVFNNNYEDQGQRNARTLMRLLQSKA